MKEKNLYEGNTTFGKCCKSIRYGIGTPPQYSDDGIPFIRATNVKKGTITPNGLKFISAEDSKLLDKCRISEGNLIVVRSGVNTGDCAYVPKEFDGAIAGFDLIVEFDSKGNARFFNYFINSKFAKSQIDRLKRRAAQEHLNSEQLTSLKVPNPPLPVLRQIVAELEQVEALKRQRQEADALTGALLQSVFYEMFGDPVRNERGWPLKTLKEIASPDKNSIKAGPFGSSLKKDCYTESGYKIYGQEQVIRDDLTYGDYFIHEEKFQQLIDYQVQAGDILISLVGSYGKISIVPQIFERGIINPRLMKISLNHDLILPIFFKSLFLSESVSNQIANLSHGGTMDIINVGIVKQLRFSLPPLALQQEFARVVESVERLREKQVESGRHIEGLCGGLMASAFSGELVA